MLINRYTTKTLRLIAYLWISLPLTYLLYAFFTLGTQGQHLVKMLLTPGYWFISFVAVGAAIGLLQIQWYGWYTFLFSNFLFAYYTALTLLAESRTHFGFTIFLITIATQALLIYLTSHEIRVPYFFPKIRWWESDPRYRLNIPTKIIRMNGEGLEGEIMDISLEGCFIKTHHFFAMDEPLTINFTLFEKPIQCQGLVVWKTESKVIHPKGIGFKFLNLEKETSHTLRLARKRLKKLVRTYNQMSRERHWQEYVQREEQYQTKTKPSSSHQT